MGLFKTAEKKEEVKEKEVQEVGEKAEAAIKEEAKVTGNETASQEAIKAVMAMKNAVKNEPAKATDIADEKTEELTDSKETEIPEGTETQQAEETLAEQKVSKEQPLVNVLEKAVEERRKEEKQSWITHSDEWRIKLSALQKEIEDELQKSDEAVKQAVEKEKKACRTTLLLEEQQKYEKEMEELKKEYKEKIDQLNASHKEELEKREASYKEKEEKLNAEHHAEIDKMKHTYEIKNNESQEALREKITSLRKEIDRYKEQTELLMLHIEDTFVLQEIQKQMDDKEKTAEKSE